MYASEAEDRTSASCLQEKLMGQLFMVYLGVMPLGDVLFVSNSR